MPLKIITQNNPPSPTPPGVRSEDSVPGASEEQGYGWAGARNAGRRKIPEQVFSALVRQLPPLHPPALDSRGRQPGKYINGD